MSKISDFFHKMESELLTGIGHAVKITTAILAYANSPQGKSLEDVIASVVPQGQVWTEEVVKIVGDLAVDIAALGNPISRKGIALRLGGEILAIIHGNKLPTGIDGYIAEIQKIFIG